MERTNKVKKEMKDELKKKIIKQKMIVNRNREVDGKKRGMR